MFKPLTTIDRNPIASFNLLIRQMMTLLIRWARGHVELNERIQNESDFCLHHSKNHFSNTPLIGAITGQNVRELPLSGWAVGGNLHIGTRNISPLSSTSK